MSLKVASLTKKVEKLRQMVAGLLDARRQGDASHVTLWAVDLEQTEDPTRYIACPRRVMSAPSEIPAIDVIAIPTGKFFAEEDMPEESKMFPAPPIPEHERVRMFAHLPEIPPQMSQMRKFRLMDAPANPIPEPVREVAVEPTPEQQPKKIEIDRDAVIISLNQEREKRRKTTEEIMQDIIDRKRKERI